MVVGRPRPRPRPLEAEPVYVAVLEQSEPEASEN